MASKFDRLTATPAAWTTFDPAPDTGCVIQNNGLGAVMFCTGIAPPASINAPGITLAGGEDRQIEFDAGERIHVRSMTNRDAPVVIAR